MPALGLAIVLGAALLGAGPSGPPQRGEIVGGEFTYTVTRGDSLSRISARFGIGVAALARRNERSVGGILHPGEQLRVDNRHIVPTPGEEAILINIPQRFLFLFGADGTVRAHYPVGLGRPDWPTPIGLFEITELEKDPTWNVPRSIQEEMRREGKTVIESMPPCPENPLGRFWLRLSLGSLGIHGTNAPASVYTFQTHGCVRLHPDDIAELFTMVHPGERGRLVYEPVLLARAQDGRVFAEIHPDVYRRAPDAMASLRSLARDGGLYDDIDWDAAARAAALAEGIATDVSARESPRSIAK